MKCPGQDSRYWSGEDVFETPCPTCGHSVEFFKDDSQQKCRNCGTRLVNPRLDFGCASYCPFASQCLESLPPELVAKRGETAREFTPARNKTSATGTPCAVDDPDKESGS